MSKSHPALFGLACLFITACGSGSPPVTLPPVEERLAAPANAALGRSLFGECAVCHDAQAGLAHRVGPNLGGVVGQPAGRHADFAYSRALRRSGIVWSEDVLDAYLAAPESVIPGGRMAYRGNDNPADRRDIIAYLATTTEQ